MHNDSPTLYIFINGGFIIHSVYTTNFKIVSKF
jgi:hypothetical protein